MSANFVMMMVSLFIDPTLSNHQDCLNWNS